MSSTVGQTTEKRIHPRVPLEDVTVEIYAGTNMTDSVDICSIINLSRSGMLFGTHHTYPVSQVLRLTFVLPESIVIFRTNATVMHTYRERMMNFVGVHFEKLTLAEVQSIDLFISRQSRRKKSW